MSYTLSFPLSRGSHERAAVSRLVSPPPTGFPEMQLSLEQSRAGEEQVKKICEQRRLSEILPVVGEGIEQC